MVRGQGPLVHILFSMTFSQTSVQSTFSSLKSTMSCTAREQLSPPIFPVAVTTKAHHNMAVMSTSPSERLS